MCLINKTKMNKSKSIVLTNLILIPLFIASVYTGIELHIAGHGASHEIWHTWAVLHTIASLLFLALVALHVRSHWGWYKALKTIGCKGKRHAVLLLTCVFLLVLISGLLLLFFVDGAASSTGLLHYKTGLVLALLVLFHVLKRRKILLKGAKAHVFDKEQKH